MTIDVNTHWNVMVITPALVAGVEHCPDPECDGTAYSITLSWGFWSLLITW